jgi:hypothetical protein
MRLVPKTEPRPDPIRETGDGRDGGVAPDGKQATGPSSDDRGLSAVQEELERRTRPAGVLSLMSAPAASCARSRWMRATCRCESGKRSHAIRDWIIVILATQRFIEN